MRDTSKNLHSAIGLSNSIRTSTAAFAIPIDSPFPRKSFNSFRSRCSDVLGLGGIIVATVQGAGVDNLAIALAYSEETTCSDFLEVLRTSDLDALKNKFVLRVKLKGTTLKPSDRVSWYDGYEGVWQVQVNRLMTGSGMPIFLKTLTRKVCNLTYFIIEVKINCT